MEGVWLLPHRYRLGRVRPQSGLLFHPDQAAPPVATGPRFALRWAATLSQLRLNSHNHWSQKAETLRALGRFGETVGASDQALALKPDDAAAWNNKGYALYRLKRYDEALVAIDRTLALDHRHGAPKAGF